MVGSTSEGSSRIPKERAKQRENAEVRAEANSAIASRASSGKCSKPKGEYCRLHNPAPRFAGMTPEAMFDSIMPKAVNNASRITPPVLGAKLDEIDVEYKKAREELYTYAREHKIDIPNIGYYTSKYDTDLYDAKLAELDQNYYELGYAWDETMQNRVIVMNRYMDKMLHAEFPNKEDQAVAKIAVFGRFTAAEAFNDSEPTPIEELGYTQQEFFRTVNEPSFSARIENIEKAYIAVSYDNKAPEKLFDALKDMRKRRETKGPDEFEKEEDYVTFIQASSLYNNYS